MTDRAPPTVVITEMGTWSHLQRCLHVAAALVDLGARTWVFTDAQFESAVVDTGAGFCDLYAGRPLAEADDESMPRASRYVSFAGYFADSFTEEVAALEPTLMLNDAFAFIGRVAARTLGLPQVDVRSGHDYNPETAASLWVADRVHPSERCRRAVEILIERYGWDDASTMSFITHKSSLLNIYGEPELFISERTRAVLEPVAFFGSLPGLHEIERRRAPRSPAWFPRGERPRVFVSFGTIVWRQFSREAMRSLHVIADTLEAGGFEALISLGGSSWDESDVAALRRPHVAVETYVNQWQVLAEADLFVTHHGLNSTHEAIMSGVPMLSHPFYGDQPAMAVTCQDLGVALPLVADASSPLEAATVREALGRFEQQAPQMTADLEKVRAAQVAVIQSRPAVAARILALG